MTSWDMTGWDVTCAEIGCADIDGGYPGRPLANGAPKRAAKGPGPPSLLGTLAVADPDRNGSGG
jgi:hypothetical protein